MEKEEFGGYKELNKEINKDINKDINKEKNEEPHNRYFEEALSDFAHDVACGAQVRHLTEKGCSVSQIREQLDYPVSMERLKDTVWKYMLEAGIILQNPCKGCKIHEEHLKIKSSQAFYKKIRKLSDKYGEENLYLKCPYEEWVGKGSGEGIIYKCENLTSRERDYIAGIPWQGENLYHRLNSRMAEIAAELAGCGRELEIAVFMERKNKGYGK